jgi:hypothetical protein
VVDDQFQTGVAFGDFADGRQEHRRAERHQHPARFVPA